MDLVQFGAIGLALLTGLQAVDVIVNNIIQIQNQEIEELKNILGRDEEDEE